MMCFFYFFDAYVGHNELLNFRKKSTPFFGYLFLHGYYDGNGFKEDNLITYFRST